MADTPKPKLKQSQRDRRALAKYKSSRRHGITNYQGDRKGSPERKAMANAIRKSRAIKNPKYLSQFKSKAAALGKSNIRAGLSESVPKGAKLRNQVAANLQSYRAEARRSKKALNSLKVTRTGDGGRIAASRSPKSAAALLKWARAQNRAGGKVTIGPKYKVSRDQATYRNIKGVSATGRRVAGMVSVGRKGDRGAGHLYMKPRTAKQRAASIANLKKGRSSVRRKR